MDSVETTAKTADEAIQIALAKLGVARDEVEVVILEKGKSGILGIGAEPARVRVTPKQEEPDPLALAQETLKELLGVMGVSATVEVVQGDAEQGQIVNIQGEDSGLLIGRRGETLASLNFVVNFIISRKLKHRGSVIIDVEGYRERRDESLRNMAVRMAERALQDRHPVTLEPMPARERRTIHLALADNARVTTESIGEGDERQVVIAPKMR